MRSAKKSRQSVTPKTVCGMEINTMSAAYPTMATIAMASACRKFRASVEAKKAIIARPREQGITHRYIKGKGNGYTNLGNMLFGAPQAIPQPSIAHGSTPPSSVLKTTASRNLMANCTRLETGRHNCPSATPSLRSSATAIQPTTTGIISQRHQKLSKATVAVKDLCLAIRIKMLTKCSASNAPAQAKVSWCNCNSFQNSAAIGLRRCTGTNEPE